MDAQLGQMRDELAALEAERRRVEAARSSAEAARLRLEDAEAFLDGLARRVAGLSREQQAQVIRQLVPRIVIMPGEGRKARVSETYAFAPPPETYTWNCPASSSSLT
jgi:hypothetical protein